MSSEDDAHTATPPTPPERTAGLQLKETDHKAIHVSHEALTTSSKSSEEPRSSECDVVLFERRNVAVHPRAPGYNGFLAAVRGETEKFEGRLAITRSFDGSLLLSWVPTAPEGADVVTLVSEDDDASSKSPTSAASGALALHMTIATFLF